MSDRTSISWTDATWNPVRGCSRVSEGCRNCYAEKVAIRFGGEGQPYSGLVRLGIGGDRLGWNGRVRMVHEHLADPLRWKKPRRIFVNSMSDLFHERLTNEEIAAVFGVMAAAPQHTFQVLTKRATRMREWFAWAGTLTLDHLRTFAQRALDSTFTKRYVDRGRTWPLPNVWLGVSVEDQTAADERIPELLATPAAVRFLSCEPLLGPVDLPRESLAPFHDYDPMLRRTPRIDWVIAGCESGPGARPCSVEWLRSLRDQCAAASVAFFLKQAEESADCGEDGRLQIGDDDSISFDDGSRMKARRLGGNHIIELPYLDGVQHAAFPGATK